MNLNYVYDIETYPNAFTCTVIQDHDGFVWQFEISDRKNDSLQLYNFILALQQMKASMVGYNNVNFDYPVIHAFMLSKGSLTAHSMWQLADNIINSDEWSEIREWEVLVEQIDLLKIHHFDNNSRRTSLKDLEFAMKADNIEDLPYEPGTHLHFHEIDELLKYNLHDVNMTRDFLHASSKQVSLRRELTQLYGKSVINFNDTKIGKDYFITQLELNQPGICYNQDKSKNQTIHQSIALGPLIFDYVKFDNIEFEKVKRYLQCETITETKGVFSDLTAVVDGFKFVFGLGGIHGSIDSRTIESDKKWIIIDIDVEGYYPSLGVANNFYPAHLGELFCKLMADVKAKKESAGKDTTERALFKLAGNGTYGDTNSSYSPLFDSAYTMKTTINGQLLLCMLAEKLMGNIRSLEMIQANTDGLTVLVRRSAVKKVMEICKWWEDLTGLVLERNDYSRMFIRDVNNYIAEYMHGKLKRKGAYAHGDDLEWHQSHSSQVIAKAAEYYLLEGGCVETYINHHLDMYDFMIKTKVNRGTKLFIGDREVQRISRYYMSDCETAGQMAKHMPPTKTMLDKDPNHVRNPICVNAGWDVKDCNDITRFDWCDLDRTYYVAQARKLIDPLRSES